MSSQKKIQKMKQEILGVDLPSASGSIQVNEKLKILAKQEHDVNKLKKQNRQQAEELAKLSLENDRKHTYTKQLLISNKQLVASNQQLVASNQQLVASNQQLVASNQQLSNDYKTVVAENAQLKTTLEKQKNKGHSSTMDDSVEYMDWLTSPPVDQPDSQ